MKKNIFKKLLSSKRNIVIVLIVTIAVIAVILKCGNFLNLGRNVGNVKNKSEALSIGEEKYLQFLWMIDGAFNYERYNKEDFMVNGNILNNKLDFSCVYTSDKKTCEGVNFEKNFQKLFADNIKIDNVYGDGASIKWYEKRNNKYSFTNLNSCQVTTRMSTSHQLSVKEIDENKIIYQAHFEEEVKNGTYKGKHVYDKDFVLVYQDKNWKISEAYYHDPCYGEYAVK